MGRIIDLLVEKAPEDPAQIAADLADAMQSEAVAQREVATYERAIDAERRKLGRLQAVLVQVRERRRRERAGEVFPRRRMDPMAEYDVEAMKADERAIKARVQRFSGIIQNNQSKAAAARNRIPRIERRLAESRRLAKDNLRRRKEALSPIHRPGRA